MGKYKKLIAAVVGLGLLYGVNYLNITVPGINQLVMELIISALTAWGVYQVRNEA